MLEEIYFSDICGDLENKNEKGEVIGINPQRAWFDNGKFRFQFPSLWYESTCNNKAIGLRCIVLKPESVSLAYTIEVWKLETSGGRYAPLDALYMLLHFPPNIDIMEILSEIATTFCSWADRLHPEEGLRLVWSYNTRTSEATLHLYSENQQYKDETWFKMIIRPDDKVKGECDFLECFNTSTEYLEDMKDKFTFTNVWDRRSLFVHASFVTGTSFQVLGESRDVFPKPSKMYRFNGNSPDFYFELSYDGMHPQRHRFARFVIQLAYIFNDADYMAE